MVDKNFDNEGFIREVNILREVRDELVEELEILKEFGDEFLEENEMFKFVVEYLVNVKKDLEDKVLRMEV